MFAALKSGNSSPQCKAGFAIKKKIKQESQRTDQNMNDQNIHNL